MKLVESRVQSGTKIHVRLYEEFQRSQKKQKELESIVSCRCCSLCRVLLWPASRLVVPCVRSWPCPRKSKHVHEVLAPWML
jgi:hypothetical protein